VQMRSAAITVLVLFLDFLLASWIATGLCGIFHASIFRYLLYQLYISPGYLESDTGPKYDRGKAQRRGAGKGVGVNLHLAVSGKYQKI